MGVSWPNTQGTRTGTCNFIKHGRKCARKKRNNTYTGNYKNYQNYCVFNCGLSFIQSFAIGFRIRQKIRDIFIRKILANGITIICGFGAPPSTAIPVGERFGAPPYVKTASVSFASVHKPIAKFGLNLQPEKRVVGSLLEKYLENSKFGIVRLMLRKGIISA